MLEADDRASAQLEFLHAFNASDAPKVLLGPIFSSFVTVVAPLAAQFGVRLTSHRMMLFGECIDKADCDRNNQRR